MASVTVSLEGNRVFAADMRRRLKAMDAVLTRAATMAAAEAQRVSRDKARAVRPPAPPRPGRASAPGALARAIHWQAVDGEVALDRAALDANTPWWPTQEIGTGKSASARYGEDADSPNRSRGRAAKASINTAGGRHFSIKSQRGRRIPGSLAFGTGPGGQYVPPSALRNQQLYLLASLKGAPHGPQRNKATALNPIFITEEIPGKHFIRDGAREGFRDYRNTLVAAARATLAKRR